MAVLIDRWIDYRVDDHPDPVARLGDLLELNKLYFGKSPISERIKLLGKKLSQLQEIIARSGLYMGPIDGKLSPDTRTALNVFVGNENFEERCDIQEGWMDKPVFEHIIKKYWK